MSRFGQRLARAAVIVLTTIGITAGSVVIATPANASATKCAYTKTIGSAPLGQYCFSVTGSGLHIDSTSGSWNGPWVDYPREKVTFYDVNGNAYGSWITYSGSGRTYGFRYWRSGISGNAKLGSACGEFMSYGTTIGKICVNIAP